MQAAQPQATTRTKAPVPDSVERIGRIVAVTGAHAIILLDTADGQTQRSSSHCPEIGTLLKVDTVHSVTLALVSARLNDVAPDGASTRVGIGLLNLTHRKSHEHPEPLVPGETTKATVEMEDTAYAFPAGHRIALSLSNSYWPIAWPSPELATLMAHVKLALKADVLASDLPDQEAFASLLPR